MSGQKDRKEKKEEKKLKIKKNLILIKKRQQDKGHQVIKNNK